MPTQIIDLCNATLFCMRDAAFRCKTSVSMATVLACKEHKDEMELDASAHGHRFDAEPLVTAGNDAGQMSLV